MRRNFLVVEEKKNGKGTAGGLGAPIDSDNQSTIMIPLDFVMLILARNISIDCGHMESVNLSKSVVLWFYSLLWHNLPHAPSPPTLDLLQPS